LNYWILPIEPSVANSFPFVAPEKSLFRLVVWLCLPFAKYPLGFQYVRYNSVFTQCNFNSAHNSLYVPAMLPVAVLYGEYDVWFTGTGTTADDK
jgi:hypothetical protein